MYIQAKERRLDLSAAQVMGILNVTPDSFSDGKVSKALDHSLLRAEQMVEQNVAIIDVGGESTRPGWKMISVQEEIDRICPVIERIANSLDVMISVDSYKPLVMRAALDAGAHLLNDINGFRDEAAFECAVQSNAALCIMHMDGQIADMHTTDENSDVLYNVSSFFQQKVEQLLAAGVNPHRIILDPGYGFGKTHQQNLYLLKHIADIYGANQYPLLAGLSRKRMIGEITGKDVSNRISGSVAAAIYAVLQGVKIVRVHDVAETVDALKVIQHIEQA